MLPAHGVMDLLRGIRMFGFACACATAVPASHVDVAATQVAVPSATGAGGNGR
jgi:hypothetical protein